MTPRIQANVKALRLTHLVQSLGWDGAREYIAKLSPEEKKDYFVSRTPTEGPPPP